jgi:hypothetical protein
MFPDLILKCFQVGRADFCDAEIIQERQENLFKPTAFISDYYMDRQSHRFIPDAMVKTRISRRTKMGRDAPSSASPARTALPAQGIQETVHQIGRMEGWKDR